MRLRADAADAVGEQRHFLDRASDAEAFEAAQFGDLEVGVGDIPVGIQEDVNLAVSFQAATRFSRRSLTTGSRARPTSTSICSAAVFSEVCRIVLA